VALVKDARQARAGGTEGHFERLLHARNPPGLQNCSDHGIPRMAPTLVGAATSHQPASLERLIRWADTRHRATGSRMGGSRAEVAERSLRRPAVPRSHFDFSQIVHTHCADLNCARAGRCNCYSCLLFLALAIALPCPRQFATLPTKRMPAVNVPDR
jgi:hypothetical protein